MILLLSLIINFKLIDIKINMLFA